MNTWILRVLWVSLPVTAGGALADWMQPWSDAPRIVATVLLWILWAVVLSALLVPRPVASTIARLGTPLAVVVVILAAVSGDASTGVMGARVGRSPPARARSRSGESSLARAHRARRTATRSASR